MKHAGEEALNQLEPLLAHLRSVPNIKEKTRGVFYKKARPFAHFHEDPLGLFADVHDGETWQRFPVNTKTQIEQLLSALKSLTL